MLYIKNGYIKTMAGPDIENGCILIGDDGKTSENKVTAFTVKNEKGRLLYRYK